MYNARVRMYARVLDCISLQRAINHPRIAQSASDHPFGHMFRNIKGKQSKY